MNAGILVSIACRWAGSSVDCMPLGWLECWAGSSRFLSILGSTRLNKRVVLDAVEHRDFGVVIPVGVGAIVGILVFSTLLSWLLERHRATVLAALIGLMAGSLRVLWPWPAGDEGLENVSLGPPIDGQLVGCLAGAIAAALIVLAISAFAQRAEDRAVVSPNSGGV